MVPASRQALLLSDSSEQPRLSCRPGARTLRCSPVLPLNPPRAFQQNAGGGEVVTDTGVVFSSDEDDKTQGGPLEARSGWHPFPQRLTAGRDECQCHVPIL